MAALKAVLLLGVCLSAWTLASAEQHLGSNVENVRWLSLDFKTILVWTSKNSDPNYLYNVLYSEEDRMEFTDCRDCTETLESQCDLTVDLNPYRTYIALIQTVPVHIDYGGDPDVLPQTTSPSFNPYRQTNISAVKFSVEVVNESTVTVNITDTLTSIHEGSRQLTIRDIFKKDLKYKIIYYKSGSTGKKDFMSESSVAELSALDPGESYCFMVAAYISSRPRTNQHGAWSKQWCMEANTTILQELSVGAWVSGVVILLTVLIITGTTILCCRRYRQRHQTTQTSQALAPV